MDSDESDSDLNVVLDVSATNEYCNFKVIKDVLLEYVSIRFY